MGFSLISLANVDLNLDEFRCLLHVFVSIVSSSHYLWKSLIETFLRQVYLRKLAAIKTLFQLQVVKSLDASVLFVMCFL